VLELVAAERLVMFKTLHCQVHVVCGGPSKTGAVACRRAAQNCRPSARMRLWPHRVTVAP